MSQSTTSPIQPPGPRGRAGPADRGDRAAGPAASAGKATVLDRHLDKAVQPNRASTVFTGRAVLGLLITAALISIAWWSTWQWMFDRWFPAWQLAKKNLPLMQRLTGGDSYYTHGPLVPIVALIVGMMIYRRVGLPVQRTRGSSRAGWLLLILSGLAHLAAVLARVHFVSGFAMLGVVGGLVLIWGGWPLAKAYWLPVIILFFMVPMPMELIAQINYNLKFFAGKTAVWLTNHVFGIPAIIRDAAVVLPDYPDGSPKRMIIENVCGGLRSLIALTFFATLFALVCRVRGPWRLFMLLLAVPAAIGCNVLRITSLNVRAHYAGVEAAGEGSWFHDTTGLFMFALALGFLFGVEQLIILLSKLTKRRWVDERLLGFLDSIPRTAKATLATFRPGALAMLLVIAALSLLWARESVAINQSGKAKQVTSELVIDGVAFKSMDWPLDDKELTILETRDYLFRVFTDPKTRRALHMLIVFSPDNRKGTHPPEVCLTASGYDIQHQGQQQTQVPGMADGQSVNMQLRELVAAKNNERMYYLYVYKCGNSYTASFYTQQAKILLNGMLGREAGGALIRFTVPLEGSDLESARELALAAVRKLMPDVSHKLR